MAQIWSEIKHQRPQCSSKWWTSGQDWGSLARYRPDLGHFAWIWAIMLEFGPFCLDLGYIAWIWAISQNLGHNKPQRRQSPEDVVGGTNRPMGEYTDRQTDRFSCVLQDFVPFGAAALLLFNLNHTVLKQGTGTADHLLPLGCYFLSCAVICPK